MWEVAVERAYVLSLTVETTSVSSIMVQNGEGVVCRVPLTQQSANLCIHAEGGRAPDGCGESGLRLFLRRPSVRPLLPEVSSDTSVTPLTARFPLRM
jgi:hypothetical protein